MIRKILVAYDGSKSAERAFHFALEQAEVFKAVILVISVAQPPEPPTLVETTALLDSAAEHFNESFKHLEEEAKLRNIPLETKIAVGHAADQIVHHAAVEECDLIVMGHRGKSMLQRWLLGSVSKRVLSYAPCSVTIVR